MKYYEVSFKGKQLGAIGVSHYVDVLVSATSEDLARINLYTRFEHILTLKFTDITSQVFQSKYDENICIHIMYNGYYLFNNKSYLVDSPSVLIVNVETRKSIMEEANTIKQGLFK